jgi:hypothetical protein
MQHEIEFKIFDEKNEVFDFDYLTIELDAKVETADSVVGDQCVGTNLYVSEFTWNKSDFTKEDNARIQKYLDENYDAVNKEYIENYEMGMF